MDEKTVEDVELGVYGSRCQHVCNRAGGNEEENTMSTVQQIAAKHGLSPKVARAKLRRAGMKHAGARWPSLEKGSMRYKKVESILIH